ncbi:MAG: hypothetical protein KA954_01230 [Chitinophagales bacterium]|nr:hypothetical protein [Chitinophagales bacterium]
MFTGKAGQTTTSAQSATNIRGTEPGPIRIGGGHGLRSLGHLNEANRQSNKVTKWRDRNKVARSSRNAQHRKAA